jgi:hypothetical protein
MEAFLASVSKVYLNSDKPLDKDKDFVIDYNSNKNFDTNDIRFLGAIEFKREYSIEAAPYAFPFDKNNITYPILGETVLILNIGNDYYWMPYSITQYPNYREDYKTSEVSKERDVPKVDGSQKNKDYKETKLTGTPNQVPTQTKSNQKKYLIKEKVKFLKPREGDTIITGRASNSIRFSEFFLTEDEKLDEKSNPTGGTSSPSIFIRNKQNPEVDSKKIGELIDEDINKDGTSVYITSGKVKVPFKETIKKEKVAFKDYPSSDKLKGDQLFINSDRIILSAKASEFIIFGKGNTGVITDGRYSVDAMKEIYLHTENNLTLHSKGANQIFLNSENGKIFLGKNKGEGDAGAAVQKMVLGGELVKILSDLIDEITKQIYATPVGPTSPGPTNIAAFVAIKGKLKTILSAKNYLSKS